VIVNSWLAIRNTESIRAIPDNALSDAVDVDISDAGVITKRQGSTLALTLANITSAYSTLDKVGYIVAGGILYHVIEDMTTIALGACVATEFADYGKVLWGNDGIKVESGIASTVKIPVPDFAPEMSVISGTMPAGTYSAVQCFVGLTGIEGGSSPHSTIELLVEGGITIAPIAMPEGYTVNVYMTDANGTVYYDSNGSQINPLQLLAETFPENIDQIAYYETKLFLSQAQVDGTSVVWFSQPFHPHLYAMNRDYLIIQGEVRAMMPAQGGLIIATDSAIYAYAEDALTKLADYGVPAGRSIARLSDGNVLIWSNRGVCSALPFANITQTKASFPPGLHCTTALVEQYGIQKFIAVTPGDGVAYNATVN